MEIDEIDVKILRELIKDARKRLKDIAKDCGISSTAVFNRIKRLKTAGVITGAVQYVNMERLGYLFPASIGISLNSNQEPQVIRIIKERANLIAFAPSIGKSDLTIFLVAKSMNELDYLKQQLKKEAGIERITIDLWTTPCLNFENLNLQPIRA
ncbi:MAG: Lrp/AsnC family transcriptional regulator [Candidatus Bathyarchaeota archaeon]|nr:Lrp/AsnC family transcriptional regulator [Candidatus Bathyarchaeota archaeon]